MESRRIKRQLSAACNYSYTRLALNYYMYYETSLEDSLLGGRLAPLGTCFHALLKGFLDGNHDVDRLEELRNRVTCEMEAATAYTDVFQAYEYVLNRLEGRYAPQLLGAEAGAAHEDDMTQRIMDYITEMDEAMTINERIRLVLGQLPVRMTKHKFFSLVEEGMSVYKGGSREGLKDMIYILRSEALLNTPKDMVTGYEQLHSILEEFKGADYKGMEPEQFRHLTQQMTDAGRILMEDTARLMLLMELVNDLYVLLISRDCAMMEVSEEQRLNAILSTVLSLFEEGKNQPIPETVTDSLPHLEGKQETYFEQWMQDGLCARELQEMKKQEGDAKKLYQVELLLSGSSFMSLNPSGPEADQTVDSAVLKGELDLLFEELARSFEGQPKVLVRAIMAKVLSCLPVFFESLDEVREYVKNSLVSCTDEMEKAVTMKLIGDMMEE